MSDLLQPGTDLELPPLLLPSRKTTLLFLRFPKNFAPNSLGSIHFACIFAPSLNITPSSGLTSYPMAQHISSVSIAWRWCTSGLLLGIKFSVNNNLTLHGTTLSFGPTETASAALSQNLSSKGCWKGYDGTRFTKSFCGVPQTRKSRINTKSYWKLGESDTVKVQK